VTGIQGPSREPVNPVLAGFHPDPSICRVGDRYYLANSTFEYVPGIPLYESTDLREWKPIGSAVTRPDEFALAGARDSGGLYAPTLRHHDGTFYLVGSQVDRTPSQFIITASDAHGPWSAPLWVPEASGFDPSLFFHDDKAYWCATRVVREEDGRTAIWVREIDVSTGRFAGEETVLWHGALKDATWSEGPHLFERGGWFYLLTAEGGTYRDHAAVIARSRSITGPYENHPRNPVLTHRHLGAAYPVQNVGHADFVERPDGSWAAVVLGVRAEEGRHILGRETFVADVEWEDGWPVISPGLGVLADVGDRHSCWEQKPAVIDGAFTVRGPADFAEQTHDGVVLTAIADVTARSDTTQSSSPSATTGAEAQPVAPRRLPRPSALFHRLAHHRARVSVAFDSVGPGIVTGLLLRQSDAYSLRVELCDGGFRVVERSDGTDTERESWALTPGFGPTGGDDHAEIEFVAELTADGVLFSAGGHTAAAVPTAVLSSEVAGGFVGTMWGPFVTGTTGGRARVTRMGYRGSVGTTGA